MLESELIDKFIAFLVEKYGRNVFHYKVYSCGYGDQGFPDLVVIIPGVTLPILIECKRNAKEKLRPTQIGMHKKIINADYFVCILNDSETTIKDKNGVKVYQDDKGIFSGFANFVDQGLKNAKNI